MDMTTRPLTVLPSGWIDRLFERLWGFYGNKFADMWKDMPIASVKACWAEELAGYSGEEFKRGLDALRSKHPTWPPTLFEFAALCRPSAPAIEPEAAFHEAVRGVEQRKRGNMGQWSAKAVYWAAMDVTPFDLLNSTWPQIRSRWMRAFEARSADANLPEIPEPPKQLEAPPPVRNGEDARLDAMREQVGAVVKRDPLAWAKRLIERHENGDKTVYPIALAAAKDAARIRAGGAPR